ncbi:MAG: hypothetical protein QNJ16_17825 [Rhodobacter sp.]|nr:hypothetical protein [Rhodobacter sp.]
MRVFTLLVVVALLVPIAVAADGLPEIDVEGLLDDLPRSTVRELRKSPDRFVEEVAGIIMGYGAGGSIDAAGVERYVAVRRAYIRAREMRRLLLADLNNNGAVDEAEIGVLIGAAAATARGRLLLAFRTADADGDGRVDLGELRAYAEDKALAELTSSDADALRALMAFDIDGDGRVVLDEVVLATQAFQREV